MKSMISLMRTDPTGVQEKANCLVSGRSTRTRHGGQRGRLILIACAMSSHHPAARTAAAFSSHERIIRKMIACIEELVREVDDLRTRRH
jgi:hypothetical protein